MTEERARIEEELGGREERLDCVGILGIVEAGEAEEREVRKERIKDVGENTVWKEEGRGLGCRLRRSGRWVEER